MTVGVLGGCGSKSDDKTIKIGASPSPHAEILEQVKGELEKEGYKLEIVEYNDYVIPNSVTSIGYGAFSGCSSLRRITIPESVKFIAANAFCDCPLLTIMWIPNGATDIDDGMFVGCTSLERVTIPNSVTRIGEEAFSGV